MKELTLAEYSQLLLVGFERFYDGMAHTVIAKQPWIPNMTEVRNRKRRRIPKKRLV